MDVCLIIFGCVVVISSLSGANGDCAADLARSDDYAQCVGQFSMWAATAFGGGEYGGSGSDGPPEVMTLMCTPEANAKIGCFFKYIVQCPNIMESMGGGGAAFSIPGVNMATLAGDNPLETICASIPIAPKSVTISGTREAKAGETLTLTCTTGNSNPAAVITWIPQTQNIVKDRTRQEPSPDGGFITISEIDVTLTPTQTSAIYTCSASNNQLGITIADTATVGVLYPPDPPQIFGYTEGYSVRAGTLLRMTCRAIGGNPPATLAWYKGDEVLPFINTTIGNLPSLEVGIVTKANDNGALYKCTATNRATESPLEAVKKLTVHFPPSSVRITSEPAVARAGHRLKLTCVTSSSNPAAAIQWIHKDVPVQGRNLSDTAAENGGMSSRNILDIIPTSEDHETVYGCQATNIMLQERINDAITLNVLYGPCVDWLSCFTGTYPTHYTPVLGVRAQTYAMVPDHYKTFLSMVYVVCGTLKPQMDCAMAKLEEGRCSMEPFDAMTKGMMQQQVKTMTYEENKMFMKDECPAVTDDFKTCVGTTLAKNKFRECYKSATDMYKASKARNSCEMYSANKDCLLRSVQSDCGKPAAMWLIKHSPKIVDSGLPTDCDDTSEVTPAPPRNVQVVRTSRRKMKVMWDPPLMPSYDMLIKYRIAYREQSALNDIKILELSGNTREAQIKQLNIQKAYTIRVQVQSENQMWSSYTDPIDANIYSSSESKKKRQDKCPDKGLTNKANADVPKLPRHRLINDLMARYNKLWAPEGPNGTALNVSHFITINRLILFDDDKNVLTLDARISMKWIDHQLTWDPSHYDNVRSIKLPSRLLWQPDIMLVNNAGPNKRYDNGDLNAVVRYNGHVSFNQPARPLISYCNDLNILYMGGSMACDLKFASWTNDGDTMNLQFEHDSGDKAIGNFDKDFHKSITIGSVMLTRNVKKYECCPESYIDLVYSVDLTPKDLRN